MKISFSEIKQFLGQPHVQLTFIYACCFAVLGATMSGLGPSLPELGRRTNSTDTAMGLVLTVRAAGYLIGSMGGPLFDRMAGNHVLAAALFVCSLSCALMGFCYIYGLLFLVVPFQGICMGLLDTGGNVMTLWLHDTNVEPFMQSLHFAFAIGGLLSPLIIGQIARHMNGSITISWLIIAALFLPIIFFLLRFPSPKDKSKQAGVAKATYSGWSIAVIFGTAAFLFLDIGAEASVATFLVTYSVRRNLTDEPTATLVNSAFWVFMVIGRLIAIPVSIVVKSHTILISSSILTIVATSGLWIFHNSVASLWICSIAYGLGMSVAFATSVLLAQDYVAVTGKIGTMFVVGAASGEMALPALISALFTVTNYMSLIYVCFAISIGCLIIVFFVIYAGTQCPPLEAPLQVDGQKDLSLQESNNTSDQNNQNGSKSEPKQKENTNEVEMVKLEFD